MNFLRPHQLDDYVNASDIFTSTGFPHENFVDRPINRDANGMSYAEQIVSKLKTAQPGVISVSGASQTGKTILVEYCLTQVSNPHFVIAGNDFRNEQEFWELLARKLDVSIGSSGWELKGGIATVVEGKASGSEPAPSFSVILESVKKALKAQTVIVIDDFHFISPDMRSSIMRAIKSLTRPEAESKGIKIILIFVPTREIQDANVFGDMSGRISLEVVLPLWATTELRGIALDQAKEAGKIKLLGSSVLAEECYGLPSIMQAVCLAYCEDRFPNGKLRTGQFINIERREQERIERIFARVAANGWKRDKHIYNNLISNEINRTLLPRKPDGWLGTMRQIIWYALTTTEFSDAITGMTLGQEITIEIDRLIQRISKITALQTYHENEIKICLQEMRDDTFKIYHEKLANGEHVADPVFDFDEVEGTISIFSPRFLMTLRHSQDHRRRFRKPTGLLGNVSFG